MDGYLSESSLSLSSYRRRYATHHLPSSSSSCFLLFLSFFLQIVLFSRDDPGSEVGIQCGVFEASDGFAEVSSTGTRGIRIQTRGTQQKTPSFPACPDALQHPASFLSVFPPPARTILGSRPMQLTRPLLSLSFTFSFLLAFSLYDTCPRLSRGSCVRLVCSEWHVALHQRGRTCVQGEARGWLAGGCLGLWREAWGGGVWRLPAWRGRRPAWAHVYRQDVCTRVQTRADTFRMCRTCGSSFFHRRCLYVFCLEKEIRFSV